MFNARMYWIIPLLFAIIFSAVTCTLLLTLISDEEIQEEKQRLYELIDTIPKDVEQAILLDEVEVSINEDTIVYEFSGDLCILKIVYDHEYNIINEGCSNIRGYTPLFGFLAILLGLIVGAIAADLWFKLEYVYYRKKNKWQRKKQERARKKAEKKKAREKTKEIKVIQQ